MAASKRRMHLGVFWLGTGNHAAGWRIEGAADSNSSWPIVAEGARTGRVLEFQEPEIVRAKAASVLEGISAEAKERIRHVALRKYLE